MSWNVAGVKADLLGNFLGYVSENRPWHVLCLQEAFRKTEGLVSEHGEVVYTTDKIHGGLRTPAIVVRGPLQNQCIPVGSGKRWTAVRFKRIRRLVVSLHLPHVGRSLE